MVNTINISSYVLKILVYLHSALHSWKYWHFHYIWWNIFGTNLKRVNIIYKFNFEILWFVQGIIRYFSTFINMTWGTLSLWWWFFDHSGCWFNHRKSGRFWTSDCGTCRTDTHCRWWFCDHTLYGIRDIRSCWRGCNRNRCTSWCWGHWQQSWKEPI